MHDRITRRCLGTTLGLALLFLLVRPASGTSVIAPSFEQLVGRADLVFTGQAVAQRAEWKDINGRNSIVTLITFRVEQVHKGQAGRTVTLQFLGGQVGDVALEVAEMPKFGAGERAVLFVEGNGASVSPIIGFYHGRFPLRKDATGRDSIRKHDGEPLTDVAELGHAKPATTLRAAPSTPPISTTPAASLSHEAFGARIREQLSRKH